jgi:hypothetical protein
MLAKAKVSAKAFIMPVAVKMAVKGKDCRCCLLKIVQPLVAMMSRRLSRNDTGFQA